MESPIVCSIEINDTLDNEVILMNDEDWEKLSYSSKVEITYTTTTSDYNRYGLMLLDVNLDNQTLVGVIGLSKVNSELIGHDNAEIFNSNRTVVDFRIAKYQMRESIKSLYLLYLMSTLEDGKSSISSIESRLKSQCDCKSRCIVQDLLFGELYELNLNRLHMSGLIRIVDGDKIELLNPSKNLTENLKNELGPIIGLDPHLV